LAEIAPLRADFGRGPTGVNWPPDKAIEHTSKIIDDLENVIGLSKTLNVPLIDAYTPSLVKSKYGKEGDKKYVSISDGIHPSGEGHQFMADLIAKKLQFNFD
jgi:lysophospholipase L1-like esterase